MCPLLFVPSKCLNGHGFLVDKNQAQFVELADISQTSSDYFVNCSFNPTIDSLKIQIRLKANGYDAQKLREYILEDDTKNIVKGLFPSEDDVQFEYTGNIKEEDYTKPLILNFTLKKELIARNNKIYFNPFICEKISENPFNSTERKYPIDFRYKKRKKIVASMILPEGYTLASFPDSKTTSTPGNKVKYSFSVQNNRISVQAMAEYKIESTEIKADA